MILKLNVDGYIQGYATVGGFVGGIEVDENMSCYLLGGEAGAEPKTLLKVLEQYAQEGKLSYCKFSTDGGVSFDEERYNADKEKFDKEMEEKLLQSTYIPSQAQSMNAFIKTMALSEIDTAKSSGDSNKIIVLSGYIKTWELGVYKVGDLVNIKGQTWECFQAHDNAIYPDINPDSSAWFTFWRPLHATTKETARPFVPVQGAHDMYKAGQYCVFDKKIYKCIQDTNFSPADYAQAWQVQE